MALPALGVEAPVPDNHLAGEGPNACFRRVSPGGVVPPENRSADASKPDFVDHQPGLTPLQQRVADDLLSLGVARPVAEPWGEGLADWIKEALREHAGLIRGERLYLGKSAIAGVLACEARHVAPQEPFCWTRRTARGEIIHRAIALASAGEKSGPHELTAGALDEAMAAGSSLGRWLGTQPGRTRVAVAAEAISGIEAFLSAWPPNGFGRGLVPEYPMAVDLLGGRVRVAGRVDLVLGRMGHKPTASCVASRSSSRSSPAWQVRNTGRSTSATP
jgi:hypothetical protein